MNETPQDPRDARIDKAALRRALAERLVGNRLLYFLTLPSTNEHARELSEDGWPEGTVVLAEEQTAGRGRAGRTWHSPPGVGLYFSVLLKPSLEAHKIPLLTLMAAVAGAKALRDGGHGSVIKWPNDLLVSGRKVAGILAETRLRPAAPPEVALGMGINVNQTEEELPPELREKAGSLRMDAGRPLDRTEVLIRMLLRLDEEYAALVAGGEQALIETYESLCPMARGRQVTVSGESETITGQTSGLSAQGALRVSGPAGMREIVAGEVSVAESGDADRR